MIINGTDLLLYYSTDDGVTWTALAHATSHSLSYQMKTRDVSHKRSGTGRKTERSRNNMTGSAAGLVSYDEECDYHVFKSFIKNRTLLKIASAESDGSVSPSPDTDNIVTSDIYLTDVSIEVPDDENVTYSITFEAAEDITHTNNAEGGDYYGVRFTTSQSDPDGERFSSSGATMPLHASLPVQSLMKGCLQYDNGTVNYYLDDDNWSLKADGVTASVLDGTDGQVMVEVPEHYYREWIEEGYKNIAVSLTSFTGATKVNKFYYGAYKAALNRTNNKLGSVVNTSVDWRGGNDNAAWDAADNSLLGKPATSISRTNFRTYAANRGAGWYQIPQVQASVIYRLFIVEHATRHSQKAVNAALTAEGYKQGGLGDGITTVASGDWSTFASSYPIVNNGASNSLGNGTGEVDYVIVGWPGGDETVKVNRYRGIEQPFGHIWEWREGVNIYNDHVAGTFKAHVIDNPLNFADDTTDNAREAADLPKVSGYISELSIGDKLPTAAAQAGSGSATFFADYYYNGASDSSSFFRALVAGGRAASGGSAGFACSYSSYSASYAYAHFGSRLCYLGA